MIEIDHTALPPPEPARPILASHLLAIEEKQRERFSGGGERIRTGSPEIDDYMLCGGCERGIVVGISAEKGEARLISLHLLSTILLSHLPSSANPSTKPAQPKTKATIIDTTGSVPLSLLAKILKSRILASRTNTSYQAVSTGNYAINERKAGEEDVNAKGVDEEVQRCLEMVAISRVFDVEGLWEVLGEVGRDSESGGPGVEGGREEENDEEGLEIIIIDNMTHLINELFARKEKGEAHNLLTILSRTLHTLTHTQNILTLLHNTTISTKSYVSDPSNPHLNSYQSTTSRKPRNQYSQPTSIFPSNPLKPALGQIFSQFPDLHILMSQIPNTRDDAERLYGQNEEELNGEKREVGYCYVVEVLKDETPNLGSGSEREKEERRFGGRERRWAAVEIGADGLGLVDAFIAKGNIRGLGMEREKERGQAVWSVAKIWGFGGRSI